MRILKFISFVLLIGFGSCKKEKPPIQQQPKEFKFWSTAFTNDSFIPKLYTCDSISNYSPELKWENAPAGTKSFVIIMDDPDAPNDTFVHWVVYDIPANATGLRENFPTTEIQPDGTKQGGNGGNMNNYFGPCPPSDTHRYFFKIYALDMIFNNIFNGRAKDDVVKGMQGHILKQAEIIGKYRRN